MYDIILPLFDLLLQIVSRDEAYTLTPKKALHIRALTNYTDQFGTKQ